MTRRNFISNVSFYRSNLCSLTPMPVMPTRRRVLAGLQGALLGFASHKLSAENGRSWVSHRGFIDGELDSWFTFGTMDGRPQAWTAHNCGRPYACELNPDGQELRLELHAGDRWQDEIAAGVLDSERTLVQAVSEIGSGTSAILPLLKDIWWGFSFMIEPGPAVSGIPGWDWLIFADIHSDFRTSHARAVPIQFQLDAGDAFNVQLHGSRLHPDNSKNEIYRAPHAFERGRWHDIVMRLNLDPVNLTGNGGADVYIDGARIVAYMGPLGFFGDQPYPQFQIYRGNRNPRPLAHEPVAIRYANHRIVTTDALTKRINSPPPFPGP